MSCPLPVNLTQLTNTISLLMPYPMFGASGTVQIASPDVSLYEMCYVASHKKACCAACFHPSGQLVATGSADSSIKVGVFGGGLSD